MSSGEMLGPTMALALLGSAVTILSTSLGAVPALAARGISRRAKDVLMGFSGGIMLAATAFSLVIPAIELSEQRYTSRFVPALLVGSSMLVGGLFLHLCNRFIPHEHFEKGPEGGKGGAQLRRIWLFVLAIALHNFPEGLAVGTGVGSQSMEIALPILVGIGLQDIPEGFVVALALMGVAYTRAQALRVAVYTGLVEGAAALIGFFATSLSVGVLPWALAFAGGSMLYVVSDEMIPESHRQEYAREATGGLMVGFVLMMFLDVSLS
ncbi:zinc transporter, ZIP family [Stigmatella aurantiaca]|uniref:Zinc transporter, ZIP family n=2 Tax=Stigmatella aurantiaca TaxID=41 RepID=A0A1H7KRJ6_STIAU|nr:zinc transporter, ZIP family [Stigmatella aurantiaca]